MKRRDYISLYLPLLLFFLLGGFQLVVVSAALLLLAMTTHLHLLRIERERARLRREFRRH